MEISDGTTDKMTHEQLQAFTVGLWVVLGSFLSKEIMDNGYSIAVEIEKRLTQGRDG